MLLSRKFVSDYIDLPKDENIHDIAEKMTSIGNEYDYEGKLIPCSGLVTSDSDFTKLAIRLSEAGMHVIGMGEQKTPASLVSACQSFKFLDLLYKDAIINEKDESEEQSMCVRESQIKYETKKPY